MCMKLFNVCSSETQFTIDSKTAVDTVNLDEDEEIALIISASQRFQVLLQVTKSFKNKQSNTVKEGYMKTG